MTPNRTPTSLPSLPIIDLSPLFSGSAQDEMRLAEELKDACRAHGFFYIRGHGVNAKLQEDLLMESSAFFADPMEKKMQIAMEKAGPAWRGFFPVGKELTSGQIDLKEGLYFGEEYGPNHPLSLARFPLFGKNLFPEHRPILKPLVQWYMQEMTRIGHQLMRLISLGLGLKANTFYHLYTYDPLQLFRIFHYPPQSGGNDEQWGVGAHTDYGLLTILKQDDIGGLEIFYKEQWLPAPPVNGTFICNIGDMLEKLTGGFYVSTLHRVRNRSQCSRYSMPFFFDPGFMRKMQPLPGIKTSDASGPRWDAVDPHLFQGTYGSYIMKKISKVFPDLFASLPQSFQQ